MACSRTSISKPRPTSALALPSGRTRRPATSKTRTATSRRRASRRPSSTAQAAGCGGQATPGSLFLVLGRTSSTRTYVHGSPRVSSAQGGSSWRRAIRRRGAVHRQAHRLILGALRDAGLADKTAVVVFADHGEAFGEHKLGGEPLCFQWRVALQRSPARAASDPCARQGPQVISERASLIDLAPTVLDLAGAPLPPSFRGRSLAKLVLGEPLPAGTRIHRWWPRCCPAPVAEERARHRRYD